MKNRISYFLIVFVMVIDSCSNRFMLSPDSFTKWVENEDNGMHTHCVIGKIRYDLQYKPVEYVCLIENRNNSGNSDFAKRKKELDGLQYYQLRISLDKSNADLMMNISSGDQDLYRRLSYLEFDFSNRIKLIEDGDSLPCALYHFQNYQGLAPYVDLVFAFRANPKDNKSARTLFVDDTIFGSGPLHFEFPSDVFQDTPQLNN